MEKQLKQTELVNDVYNWQNDSVLEWLHNVVGLPQYQVSRYLDSELMMMFEYAVQKIELKNV